MIKGELLIAKGGYLSNRNFSFRDNDLQYWVQTNFPSTEWDAARSEIDQRNKISKSAIILSKRIKEELDIDVFPLIKTIAIKGYRDAGQCKFMMFTKDKFKYYLFDFRAADYRKKGTKLEAIKYMGDDLITLSVKILKKHIN